jgi:predicted nucleic acid-binding protein
VAVADPNPLRLQSRFLTFLQTVTLIDVNEAIAHRAAMIGNGLRRQRQRFGFADILIAATALEKGWTLVTRTSQSFANISGLTIIDWTVP